MKTSNTASHNPKTEVTTNSGSASHQRPGRPRYIELAGRWPSGVFERNHFISTNASIRKDPFVSRLIQANGDVYRSVCEFTGPRRSNEHGCPTLVMDFDDEMNPDQARTEAVKVGHALAKVLGISFHDLWATFSGNKGVHLFLSSRLFADAAEQASVWVWRKIVAELKNSLAPTLDTSIYNPAGLIRLTNTVNTKSGLYDYPLEMAELETSSIDDIQQLAKHPREDDPWTRPGVSERARRWLLDHITEHNKRLRPTQRPQPRTEGRRRGWHTPPCVRQAEHEVIPDGHRHDTLHSLARFYFSVGMASDEIVDRLQEIDSRHPIRDPDFILRTVDCVEARPGFYGCPNPGLEPLCNPESCPLNRNCKPLNESDCKGHA